MSLSLPESLVARSLAQLELQGVGLIARVDAAGALQRPAAFATLLAAARTALPLIHTVIVPPLTDAEVDEHRLQRAADGTLGWRDPQGRVVVLPTRTLAEAVGLLSRHQQHAGRDCGCHVPETYAAADFVGRETVLEAIEHWIATHRTGYLVLVGRVGAGKSWLLAELIRRYEVAGGRRALTHFVPTHGGAPDAVTSCLLARLERRYSAVTESSIARLNAEERLRESLATWSAAGSPLHDGQPELVCLDGADQVTLRAGGALLPDVLPPLPDGVVGIITASHLAWCRDLSQVTVWDLHRADPSDATRPVLHDRQDIRTFILGRNSHLAVPLAPTLIDAICGDPTSVNADAHGEPPVFFTVRKNLDDLEDPLADPTWQATLRTEAAPWRAAAEVRVNDDLRRACGRWEAARTRRLAARHHRERFWRALALLLAVGEPVSEDTLRALGLWTPTLAGVFGECARLFGPRPTDAALARATPYVFDHPAYARLLAGTSSDPHAPSEAQVWVPRYHQQLARMCQRWRTLTGSARIYALRHRLLHLREAERWNPLADALLDIAYLDSRLTDASTIDDLLPDCTAAVGALPRDHDKRAAAVAVTRVLRQDAHLLGEDPTLLVQQLYNALVWDWKSTSRLGQQLHMAARQYRRPWLKLTRAAPPALTRDPALLATLKGHTDEIAAVAMTANGATIVSGSGDGIRLWDGRTGACRATLMGHACSVNAVALTPDGATIVSGNGDGTVRLWDGRTGACRATLTGHTYSVEAVAITPDAATIVSGGRDDHIRVWDGHSGALRHTIYGGRVTCVAVTSDAATIVSASGGSVRVWDGRTGACRATLTGHTDHVGAVAMTPDAGTIVSGSWDKTIRVWDGPTGALRSTLVGHGGWVWAVAVTADGATIVSGSSDMTARVWDGRTGTLRQTLVRHSGWVRAVAVTADGATIVSGSADMTARVWDGRTGASGHAFAGDIGLEKVVAATPDGETIVSVGDDHNVRVWDGRTGALRRTLGGHLDLVRAVAVTHDGTTIVSASDDRTIRVWNGRTGGLRHTLAGDTMVTTVAVTPDGVTIVVSSEGGYWGTAVHVWDGNMGILRHTLDGHTGRVVEAVAVTPDGTTIVSGSDDETVRVWNARTGLCCATLVGHRHSVTSVAVTPDGATIVSGDRHGAVRTWDARTGACRGTLAGHTEAVTAVALTPDGATIVSGSRDGTVRVWEERGRKLLAVAEMPARVGMLMLHETNPCRLILGASGQTPGGVVAEFVRPATHDLPRFSTDTA